jgi:hypothetical protein
MRYYKDQHPGGFTKWVLDLDLLELRIHYWPRTLREDIHNERRPFISLVLRGGLEETRWHVSDPGPYRLLECREAQRLCQVGTAAARPIQTFRRRPGTIYWMPSSDWHSVWAKPSTLTLSVRFQQCRRYPQMISDMRSA